MPNPEYKKSHSSPAGPAGQRRYEVSTKLTFVGNDADGLPLKRKHVQRACESCRTRKKRCHHLSDDNSRSMMPIQPEQRNRPQDDSIPLPWSQGRPTSSRQSSLNTNVAKTVPDGSSPLDTSSPSTSETNEDERESSFVGDLNPEAIFLSSTSPQVINSPENDGIGVWSNRRIPESIHVTRPKDFQLQEQTSLDSSDPVVSSLLLPYLQEQSLNLLPTEFNYEGLSKIYFENVHVIFPVINKDSLNALQENRPVSILLKQAICLAASTDPRAKRFLQLRGGSELNQRDFAKKLSVAMRTSIDFGLVRDKIVLIQALATLSLFTQLSDDRHLSAELLGRAVSLVHTSGLHLQTQKTRKDHDFVTRLFCCVWALDRLNAAFHGRPVLMHERDFGHDLDECFRQQEPCFQLLLRIILLLDKIIGLYRPTKDNSNLDFEAKFPSFEGLAHISAASTVPSHLLATTETLYHAVAMLSYRSQSVQELPQSSAAYIRQSLSATRITSIVGEEFHNQLCLLPIVPYALSLALRASYRELRLSKAPLFRTRARKRLLLNCSLLRELGDIFWSAVHMVELAEQTIQEMDRVFSTIVHEQHQDRGSGGNTVNNSSGHDMADVDANRGITSQASRNQINEQGNSESELLNRYDPNNFDFSAIEDMPEFDIFQRFDPNFGLEAIDATLGYGLHPSFLLPLDGYTG